jgi:survival of motor neuron protein-interacting protein 1
MLPYDSDEEADRHAGLRTRALPVADLGGDFDDDAPPADGLEYLARVRREAAGVPDVMVADADALSAHANSSDALPSDVITADADTRTTGPANYGHDVDENHTTTYRFSRKRFAVSAPVLAAAAAAAPASAPKHARVSPAWRREFLAWFSDVRADVARLVARRRGDSGDFADVGDFGDVPRDADRGAGTVASASFAAAAAAALASAAALEDGDGADAPAPFPSLRLVADADEVSTAAALREHARAIEERFFLGPGDAGGDDACGDETRVPGERQRSAKEKKAFSSFRSAWFFALASRADAPLDADTSAAMRGAARGFAAARAATTSEHDPSLPDLQVGLAIAGGYFGQEGT